MANVGEVPQIECRDCIMCEIISDFYIIIGNISRVSVFLIRGCGIPIWGLDIEFSYKERQVHFYAHEVSIF